MIDRELLEKAAPVMNIGKLEQAWDAFQAASSQKEQKAPHIVCTGIYNAGKSTLLNALMDKDRFPTGDIPTTKAVAQAEFGGAVYVDTPGLNAEAEDDAETQTAYVTADFILFVSNAQNGGVSDQEAKWLLALRERYTAEGLKRRLIYVLTHSRQVDEEELPGIQRKFEDDLRETLGFAPKKIFSVDSILYQTGRERNEPILTDGSNIPALRQYLEEQIESAEDTLRQAQEAELCTRKQELSDALKAVRTAVQNAYDAEYKQAQAQAAEIDAAWAEFERSLDGAMPTEKISPISVPDYYLGYRYQVEKDRSFDAAWRKSHELARPYYDKMERIYASFLDTIRKAFQTTYSSTGYNSPYSKACDKLNQAFEAGVLKLQQSGIPINSVEALSISGDLAAEIQKDCAYEYGYVQRWTDRRPVESFGDIKDWATVDSTTEYTQGFFGGMKEVTVWNYSASKAVDHMQECLADRLRDSAKDANDGLNSPWRVFRDGIKEELTKRKSALKSQVDAYKKSLSDEKASFPAQDVLRYLFKLEKEAGL